MIKKSKSSDEGLTQATALIQQEVEKPKGELRKSRKGARERAKDQFYALELRRVSKDGLDLLRSFLMVAVICYGSSKSSAWYLTVMAAAAKFALGVNALSYIINYLAWFEKSTASKWVSNILALVFVVVVYVLLNAVFAGINITIDELVRTRM